MTETYAKYFWACVEMLFESKFFYFAWTLSPHKPDPDGEDLFAFSDSDDKRPGSSPVT